MVENIITHNLTQNNVLCGVKFLIVYGDKYMEQQTHIRPPHIHTSLEIFFNEYSDVSFLVNGTIRHVGYGDAVVSRANDVHVCIYERNKQHRYFCLWIEATENSPLLSFFYKEDFSPFYTFEDDVKKKLTKLFFSLLDVAKKEDKDLERSSIILQILYLFKTGAKKNGKSDSINDEFDNVLDYINTNFAEITCLNQIAQQTYLSQATINRLFKKYTGESPKKYLESVKLSNAAKLLKSGTNVTEACFDSGFSDCSYFISVFKKRFLTTPHKYKETK